MLPEECKGSGSASLAPACKIGPALGSFVEFGRLAPFPRGGLPTRYEEKLRSLLALFIFLVGTCTRLDCSFCLDHAPGMSFHPRPD